MHRFSSPSCIGSANNRLIVLSIDCLQLLLPVFLSYWQVKRRCPKCSFQWTDDITPNMFNLKKVDFFWINRDQKSFEWFVKLLSQLEIEQSEQGGTMGHFLEMHMYITSALQKTDMKAVGLQLALDLLHEKVSLIMITVRLWYCSLSIIAHGRRNVTW